MTLFGGASDPPPSVKVKLATQLWPTVSQWTGCGGLRSGCGRGGAEDGDGGPRPPARLQPPIAVEHWGGGCSPTAVDSSFMAVDHPQPPSVALRTALAVAERPSPAAPCRCQTVSSGLLSGVGCSPTLVDDPPPKTAIRLAHVPKARVADRGVSADGTRGPPHGGLVPPLEKGQCPPPPPPKYLTRSRGRHA